MGDRVKELRAKTIRLSKHHTNVHHFYTIDWAIPHNSTYNSALLIIMISSAVVLSPLIPCQERRLNLAYKCTSVFERQK